MNDIFASIVRLDKNLEAKIQKEADKLFGSNKSFIKDLWVQRQYNTKGGKSNFNFKPRPSRSFIKDFANVLAIAQELEESQVGLDAKTYARYKSDLLVLLTMYNDRKLDDLQDALRKSDESV